jgi:site-specific DNA-methyltransferase (adenine-specific)
LAAAVPEYVAAMPKKSDAPKVTILQADCRVWMQAQRPGSVRCVITSPPYNLGIAYSAYEDSAPRADYLRWLDGVFQDVRRVLDDDGHFFLNVGYSNTDPWVDFEVASVARKHFHLQNRITWVKSITVGDETHGHFKPINSPRFLNATNEIIFHFTKSGSVPVDRQAVGVPYKWKCNLDKRGRIRGRLAKKLGFENWRDFEANASQAQRASLDEELEFRVERVGDVQDRRCRGNSWFIPYDTIRDRELDRGTHPATFPVALPEMCIRFAACPKGSLIYDPFVGSGTTMIAARDLGMAGVGTDIDKGYVSYANARLAATKQRPGLFDRAPTGSNGQHVAE